MVRKLSPFSAADYPRAKAKRQLKRYYSPEDPDLRPDELQLQDDRGADYARRKKVINSPFRSIVF